MSGLIKSGIAVLMFVVAALSGAGEDVKYSSIAAIHARPQTERSRATVQATLTLNGNPSYVQDSTGGAEVDGLSTQGLKIGDELLVTGHPQDVETGLTLSQSRVDLLWHGSPVPPLSVTPDDAALGKFAALLIEVNGRFIDTERRNGETWLRLESGHKVFLARFNTAGGSSLLPQIETGSMVRLRGVCSLQPRDTQYQGGFAILLRSAEDVAVISGPPWWSLRHLIELGILLGVLVIAVHLSLVQVLKGRFRAIMAERSRLGHELHDTLAQSFAGLSYQIQAAKKIAPKTHGLLTKHLDVALDMVRHSHAEAHRSIMMLRPQHLAEGAGSLCCDRSRRGAKYQRMPDSNPIQDRRDCGTASIDDDRHAISHRAGGDCKRIASWAPCFSGDYFGVQASDCLSVCDRRWCWLRYENIPGARVWIGGDAGACPGNAGRFQHYQRAGQRYTGAGGNLAETRVWSAGFFRALQMAFNLLGTAPTFGP